MLNKKINSMIDLSFLADKKSIVIFCIVANVIFIGLFSTVINIFSIIKYGLKLRYILPIYSTFFIYILLALILFILDLAIIYQFKRNFSSLNINHKGSSRFTTVKELVTQYKCIPEKGDFTGKGGVIISHINDYFLVDDNPVNNIIIGITRSGKFEVFVAPVIDIYSRSEEKPSLVINDPKGEVASSSYQTLKDRGYDIFIINTTDPNHSNSYNPLCAIKNAYKNDDLDMAQTLTISLSNIIFCDDKNNSKDTFWDKSSSTLCSAIILAHVIDCVESNQEEKINMYSIANFLSTLGSQNTTNPFTKESENVLDKFFEIRKQTDIAKRLYGTVMLSTGQTRTSIFTNTMNKLNQFSLSNVARMTAQNQIDLKSIGFGKKPAAIFLLTPDYDSSLHFLSSIFVKQLYSILARECSLVDNGKCSREVVFILDEFGNMPPIPDMDSVITVCLSRNIRFNLVIQDYEQLNSKYPKAYKTIISNCGNQIYLLTSSDDTASKFSKLLGSSTEKTYSRSGHILSFEKSLGEHYDEKPLLNAKELMELKQGESIVHRVMKRIDLSRKEIVPHPIYNRGETKLKARLSYLTKEFDTSKNIYDIKIDTVHKEIKLDEIIYLPEAETTSTNLIETIPLEYKTEETSEENTQLNTSILSEIISTQKLNIIEKKLGIIIDIGWSFNQFQKLLDQLIKSGEILIEEKNYILEQFKMEEGDEN